MSFQRMLFYSAVVGGWAAFAGWLLSELLLLHRSMEVGYVAQIVTAALVGAAIAGGLNLLAGLASGRWQAQVPRVLVGFGGGFLGGLVGMVIGNLIYTFLPRALGWMLMGLAIGSVDGLYDRSGDKIKKGLIGGGLGGFLGGLLFDPIVSLFGGAMASRATAFVILGLCIGLFIGLAQILFKQAWLTVEQGFRPGRQLILNLPETVLGTSEKAQLPFIAYGAKGVEPIHLRILRQADGSFVVADNHSRTGTLVNGQRVQNPVILKNGDLIQFGVNAVRYQESFRRSESREMAAGRVPGGGPAHPLAAGAGAMAEAIVLGPAPVPSRPVPPPLPHRPGDIQVGIPVAPPPSRPAHPGQAPPRKPHTPVMPGPAPAPPPLTPQSPLPAHPPEATSPGPAATVCPICGRPGKGPVGKRLCDNCGIRF